MYKDMLLKLEYHRSRILKAFIKQGYFPKQEEIASKLAIHPYRVKLACRNFVRLSYDNLLNIISYLQKLDNDIKSMKTDPYIGLELFFINFDDIKKGV